MTVVDALPLAALSDYSIPLAALIVSASALIAGALSARSTRVMNVERALVDQNNVLQKQLEERDRRLDKLESDLETCHARYKEAEEKNYEMMRRLWRLENGHGGGADRK